MNEKEFLEKYSSEKEMYLMWGSYINEYILSKLTEKGINNSLFLKIDPKPRLKDDKSIISKAFYRKQYTDPYMQIEDKIGIRFVVLLREHIEQISEIITSNMSWKSSNDKDYLAEIQNNPYYFGYQSKHYVIKNKTPFYFKDVLINAETPCEVQIRTLMQHAHSELTHDTIYKPSTNVSNDVQRVVARSMALIETTDCLFEEVDKTIMKSTHIPNDLISYAEELYSKELKPDIEIKLSNMISDTYKNIISAIEIVDFKQFLNEKHYIFDHLRSKYETALLFRQPIVLILFYLVSKMYYKVSTDWPLESSDLESILKIMGISNGPS